jgi:hypothetical protein
MNSGASNAAYPSSRRKPVALYNSEAGHRVPYRFELLKTLGPGVRRGDDEN